MNKWAPKIMPDIHIKLMLVFISICGGGVFTTNLYFVKMCIENNKRLSAIEAICNNEHGNFNL